MSDVKHTPLEWETDNRPSTMGMIIYGDCNTDNMHAIAIVRPQNDDMHVKDARYIVTACNAYPALVEALEQVEQNASHTLDCSSRHPMGECTCFKSIVSQALAQAQGDE